MRTELNRLATVLALATLGLGAWVGIWSVWRDSELTARPDNPRPRLIEQRLHRGAILDRHGAPLANSETEGGEYVRRSLVPEAALITGYSSVPYGRSGLEAALDNVLSGEASREPWTAWWEDLRLGGPADGEDVRLTIDAELQRLAAQALEKHAGAVVLIDISSGDLLVLASAPGYDPNRLEEEWANLLEDPNAPLLNRATLGLYQPGGSLQPLVLAAALDEGLATLDMPIDEAGEGLTVDGFLARCATPLDGGAVTLVVAFQHACPAAFAELGQRLDSGRLLQAFGDAGLFDAPDIVVETASGATPELPAEAIRPTVLTAIGQGPMTISPLQVALATAAIANRGTMPAPRLIMATELPSGEWMSRPASGHPVAAITPEAAEAVRSAMADFEPGPLAVSAVEWLSWGGHLSTALSGPGGKLHTWFVGFAPDDRPRFVVVVLIEADARDQALLLGTSMLALVSGERQSSPAS